MINNLLPTKVRGILETWRYSPDTSDAEVCNITRTSGAEMGNTLTLTLTSNTYLSDTSGVEMLNTYSPDTSVADV